MGEKKQQPCVPLSAEAQGYFNSLKAGYQFSTKMLPHLLHIQLFCQT